MKRILSLLLAAVMLLSLAACSKPPVDNDTPPEEFNPPNTVISLDTPKSGECNVEGTVVQITDHEMRVNGEVMTEDPTQAVYRAFDMVYYEADKGPAYGAGTTEDEHPADRHIEYMVIHITQPGTYILNGYLSKGQILVDLGENAKTDPNAVVNIYLNGVKIQNPAAPCILFQNVYECDTGTEKKDVDTSTAGASVFLAKDSINILNGSYVAEIYEPDSVVVEDGKIVAAETLYEYDGAIHSRMSMNVAGEGITTINAEKEGISSEMHLTMAGGTWYINAKDDCLNTNFDLYSVMAINDGSLYAHCIGDEGDALDSNGWIVINGGYIMAASASNSADAGLDSDSGIHIYGGIVCATGNMHNSINEDGQNFVVFQFNEKQKPGSYALVDNANMLAAEITAQNEFSILVMSSPKLVKGEYKLMRDSKVLTVAPLQEMQAPGLNFNRPGMTPDILLPGGYTNPKEDMMPPANDPETSPQPPEPPQSDVTGEAKPGDVPPEKPAEPPVGPNTEDQTDIPEKPEGFNPVPPEADMENASQTVVIDAIGNYYVVIGG